jgi:hypothetical protein
MAPAIRTPAQRNFLITWGIFFKQALAEGREDEFGIVVNARWWVRWPEAPGTELRERREATKGVCLDSRCYVRWHVS